MTVYACQARKWSSNGLNLVVNWGAWFRKRRLNIRSYNTTNYTHAPHEPGIRTRGCDSFAVSRMRGAGAGKNNVGSRMPTQGAEPQTSWVAVTFNMK